MQSELIMPAVMAQGVDERLGARPGRRRLDPLHRDGGATDPRGRFGERPCHVLVRARIEEGDLLGDEDLVLAAGSTNPTMRVPPNTGMAK